MVGRAVARPDRVAGRHAPVQVDTEHLAVAPIRNLGPLGVAGVAHGHPQLVIRPDLHGAAVVAGGRVHTQPDDEALEVQLPPAVDVVLDHLVAPLTLDLARGADIREATHCEMGIEGDAHRAGLAVRMHPRDGRSAQQRRIGLAALEDAHPTRSLGDEHLAARREGHVPRDGQSMLDDASSQLRRGCQDRRGQHRGQAQREGGERGETEARHRVFLWRCGSVSRTRRQPSSAGSQVRCPSLTRDGTPEGPALMTTPAGPVSSGR